MTNAVAQEVSYAGLGQRALAFLIDSIVCLVFVGQAAGWLPADAYEDAPVVVGVVFLVLFSLAFNYFWFAEWKFGKTLGKAIVSIHVTSEDGERLRFGPATVRNIMRLIDVLGIGPIMIGNSERHQRLGDRFAHSIVVRDKPPPPRRTPARPVPPPANPGPNPPPAVSPAPVAPPTHNPVHEAAANPAIADAGASERLNDAASSSSELAGGLGARASGSGADRGRVNPWAASVGIPTPTWGPLHIVWAVLAVIGLLVAESAIVAIFDPDPDSGGGLLAIQGLVALNLIGVAFGFASLRESPFVAPGRLGLRGFAPSALGIAALAYLAYIVFAAIYAPLFSPEQEDVTRDLGVDEGGVAAVAAGVLIVGLAPFSEEIFFRGFMYGGLRRRVPVWAAAGISGLIFGLLHYTGPDSLAVVPQLAVLGILLAWLYERTGSLWLPIILHVINNGIAFAVLTST
jgi:membrane protease YdiL (CAAX protease family)/uncharacterized RDD family membrane protein YckC